MKTQPSCSMPFERENGHLISCRQRFDIVEWSIKVVRGPSYNVHPYTYQCSMIFQSIWRFDTVLTRPHRRTDWTLRRRERPTLPLGLGSIEVEHEWSAEILLDLNRSIRLSTDGPKLPPFFSRPRSMSREENNETIRNNRHMCFVFFFVDRMKLTSFHSALRMNSCITRTMMNWNAWLTATVAR